MSDKKFSAIRARLKYETLSQFRAGYSKFVSTGGMFIPVPQQKLKPIGATIRFQFLLADGSTALLGEGTVLQVREPNPDSPRAPVGMLIKFSKLSPESKRVVDEIVAQKDEHKTPTQEVDEPPLRETQATPRGQLPAQGRTDEYSDEDKTYEMSVDQFLEMKREEERHDTHPGGDPFGNAVEPQPALEQPTSPAHDIEPSEQYAPDPKISAAISPTPVGEDSNSSDTANLEPSDEIKQLATPTADLGEHTANLAEESSEPLALELAGSSEPELLQEEPQTAAIEEKSEPIHTALDEPSEGGVRVLSYDDMSKVEGDVDFGFSGEESEIDDMFDDLFGATDNDSFFDEILGGGDSGVVELAPDDLISESEPIEEEEPALFEPLDEPVTSPDINPDLSQDDVSLEDIFESESESEEIQEQPAPAIDSPTADDTVSDLYAAPSKEENPFRADDEPSSPLLASSSASEPAIDLGPPVDEQKGMFDAFDNPPADESSAYEEISEFETVDDDPVSEPVFEAFDESSPAIAKPELEPDPEPSFDPDFDLPDSAPSSSGPRELDNLLEHLEDDVPVGVASTLNLGSQPDIEPEEPVQIEESDGESLEALLALANRDIETKRDAAPAKDEDILDQLLGDDLPPPPTEGSSSFGIPTPEKKEKKGFMSKLFGKD